MLTCIAGWNWYMNGGEADIREFIPPYLIITFATCNLAMLLWVLSDFWPYWSKNQVRNKAGEKHASKVGASVY